MNAEHKEAALLALQEFAHGVSDEVVIWAVTMMCEMDYGLSPFENDRKVFFVTSLEPYAPDWLNVKQFVDQVVLINNPMVHMMALGGYKEQRSDAFDVLINAFVMLLADTISTQNEHELAKYLADQSTQFMEPALLVAGSLALLGKRQFQAIFGMPEPRKDMLYVPGVGSLPYLRGLALMGGDYYGRLLEAGVLMGEGIDTPAADVRELAQRFFGLFDSGREGGSVVLESLGKAGAFAHQIDVVKISCPAGNYTNKLLWAYGEVGKEDKFRELFQERVGKSG